jgi:hypothetical protein
MKVEFKKTFFESVEKVIWYDSKLFKVWDTITRGIPRFITNVYKFRKELYDHAWWDYRYTLEMLHRSLVIMESKMHDGMEIRETRDKKVQKMQRAIQLLKSKIDDDYVDRAQLELGNIAWKPFEFEPIENSNLFRMIDNDTAAEKKHMTKVFAYARKIEEAEWKELWKIFEGQDYKDYRKITKKLTPKEMQDMNVWNDWFDGSDLRGWWD